MDYYATQNNTKTTYNQTYTFTILQNKTEINAKNNP